MLKRVSINLALVIALLAALAAPVVPVAAQEQRLSPELEERAKVLFLELRCVVCQNQSIGDSDADVARDLREIVREQISAGKTNSQIKDFLVARYGEFILLQPVFAWHTAALWIAPFILLIVGGILAWRVSSKRPKAANVAELSKEDQVELDKIVNDYKG